MIPSHLLHCGQNIHSNFHQFQTSEINNTNGTFDSLKSMPSFAPSFGSTSRASSQALSSRNSSLSRNTTTLPEVNYMSVRRTGTDFDHRPSSVEPLTVEKCFGFDDDDDDDDISNITVSTPTPTSKKVEPSALKRVRSELKRFLHGPISNAAASKQSKQSADDRNKREQPNLFKSPAKNKPANVFDEPNKQKDIRSAFEAKTANERNAQPSTSNANRMVLFEDEMEIVSRYC